MTVRRITARERWTAVLAGLSLALLPAVAPPLPGSADGPTAAPLRQRAQAQQKLLRIGAIPVPERVQRVAGSLMAWVPLLSIGAFAVIGLLAQLRLNWIAEF